MELKDFIARQDRFLLRLQLRRGKIEDLRKRLDEAVHAGSARAIEKQHAKGKMTARERIEKLVDAGSFTELDEFATVCLAPATLRMVLEDLSEREESERPDITIPPESYRYAAYRTFTKWARRRGRKGHRHVIPSCVVTSIRKTYPDPNHVYTGFYY